MPHDELVNDVAPSGRRNRRRRAEVLWAALQD
jgi:hypothetical protein